MIELPKDKNYSFVGNFSFLHISPQTNFGFDQVSIVQLVKNFKKLQKNVMVLGLREYTNLDPEFLNHYKKKIGFDWSTQLFSTRWYHLIEGRFSRTPQMRGKRFNLCLTKESHALKINYKLEKRR